MNTTEIVVRAKPKPVKATKGKARPVKKVSSRGQLVKRAHDLMRRIVLLRDGGCVCPMPSKGHSPVRQAGHLIKSTKGRVRWDLYNVNEQCASCNGRHNQYEHYYVGWFLEKFGAEEYLRLKNDADGVGLKTYELEELIEQLEAILAKQAEDATFKPYFTQADILSGAWREQCGK